MNSYISKQINLDKEQEPKEKRYFHIINIINYTYYIFFKLFKIFFIEKIWYLNLSHRNAYNPFSNIIIIIVRGMQIVISIIMNLFKYIIKLKIKNDSKKNFLSISSLLINKEKYTLILFI